MSARKRRHTRRSTDGAADDDHHHDDDSDDDVLGDRVFGREPPVNADDDDDNNDNNDADNKRARSVSRRESAPVPGVCARTRNLSRTSSLLVGTLKLTALRVDCKSTLSSSAAVSRWRCTGCKQPKSDCMQCDKCEESYWYVVAMFWL